MEQVWVADPAIAILTTTIVLTQDFVVEYRIAADRYGFAVTASSTIDSGAVLPSLGRDGVSATIRMDASSPDDLAVCQNGGRIDGGRAFVAGYDGCPRGLSECLHVT